MHQNAPDCTAFANDEVHPEQEETLEALEATLSGGQLRAVSLLLLGHSATSVSNAVGVDRSTLFRWRQQKAFATVLRFRQEALFLQATDRLRATLVKAVREVQRDLKSRHADDRLRTAFRLLPYVGSPKLRPQEPKGRAASTEAHVSSSRIPTAEAAWAEPGRGGDGRRLLASVAGDAPGG